MKKNLRTNGRVKKIERTKRTSRKKRLLTKEQKQIQRKELEENENFFSTQTIKTELNFFQI